ncbi:ABC transporter ATP-binding protein [Pigmentiphaga sp. YJ18]|uniref:ABC transporter ATP-binding protein n=1 Tax=Pigmentiphaga sp. YJ18 TaxID=3134907 RepID=UPI0031125E7D
MSAPPPAAENHASGSLLQLEHVRAGYGDAMVLDDLSFSLGAGDSLAVLGRNGVGKTTLLETLMGNTRMTAGRLLWQGRDIARLDACQRSRAGLGWVPQEREVFASLTVEENLTVVACRGPWTLDRVYGLFPRLRERRNNLGNELSGGEQQMLAVGRALMTNPRLLLLDEPMEGLAPIVVEELGAAIIALHTREGMTTIVVEQHPVIALAMASTAIILDRGRIVHRSSSAELRASPETLDRWLNVAAAE